MTTMPTPQVSLRRSTGADRAALRALADAHFEDLLPGLPIAVVSLQTQAQELGYQASCPGAVQRVIELDGVVAGRLLVDGVGPAYHLVDVVVHPAQRGRGLGSAALRAWLAEVDREGATVTLRVGALSPARRWYERHGFTDDPGVGDGLIHLTMRREGRR